MSKYIAPRVMGRVLDEKTHLPLKDVAVQRLTSNESFRPMDAPKGGQLMLQPAPVRTSEDGTFTLDGERDFTPFRTGWYSVTLSFRHPSYQEFVAYYTIADSTNVAGVPTVRTGDILLLSK